MAIEIKDGSSANKLAVNATGEASVNLAADSDAAGFAILAAETHPTENGVTREVYELEANDDYALRTTNEALMFSHVFAGAAVNTGLFRQGTATATITQTGGVLTLNAGSSVTSGHAAVINSYQFAENTATSNLYCSIVANFAQAAHPANCTVEWGLATFNAGAGTGTTAPTDGVYFRINSSGALEGIVRANGVDVGTTGIITDYADLIGASITRDFLISVSDRNVRFWINNAIVGRIELPASAPTWTWTNTYCVFARLHNTGTVGAGTAQQIRIAEVAIKRDNVADTRALPHAMAAVGQHASQGQTGETLGSTANYANSANPTAAVPTNTTAALGSGLGGQFWETDTLAVTTDGVISSYQVPAATSAIPGKSLYITRVTIDSYVQTALTGGGYVAQWSLAYGHTAVSIATAEAAAAKAPRRFPLGVQTVASAAAALTLLQRVEQTFDPPLCVQPGEFVATVKKKIGTAPSAGTIAHVIAINGYRA